jgi:hypothetical protein
MIIILSRVLVPIDVFWLIEWLIDCICCTLYIHTPRDYGQYSAITGLHPLQITVELGLSVFTSRILVTDLSQSHCHCKSHVKFPLHSLTPFLSLFCNCQFGRLDSIQFFCSQAHVPAGWHFETRLVTLRLLLSTTSKSKLIYDWRITANQFVLESNPLRLTTT